jgi:hypothetical protein
MGRYTFVSPGGMAAGAMERLLLAREEQEFERQRIAIEKAREADEKQRREDELELRRQIAEQEAAFETSEIEVKRQEAARKAAREQDTAGVRSMIAESMGAGPMTPDRAGSISAMAYRENLPVPGIVSEALKPKDAKPGSWRSAGSGLIFNEETGSFKQGPRVAGEDGGGQGAPAVSDAYTSERRTRIRDAVKDVEALASGATTGAASYLSGVRGTPQRDFSAMVDYLKSNIGFSELTEMRAASKTGGALGQVSDRELTLLTSALGALDVGQSPAAFKKQLQNITDSLDRWEQAKEEDAALKRGAPSRGAGAGPGPAAVQKWGRDAQGRPVRVP